MKTVFIRSHLFFLSFMFLLMSFEVPMAQTGRRITMSPDEKRSRILDLENQLAKADTDTAKARINMQLATVNKWDDLNKAINLAKEGMDYAKKSGDIDLIIRTHFGLGSIYYQNNRLDEALDLFKSGLVFLNDQDLKRSEFIGNYYILMGQVYDKKGVYEKALEYFREALNIYEEISIDNFRKGSSKMRVGSLLSKTGDQLGAIKMFEEAILVFQEKEMWDRVGGCYHNIGNCYVFLEEEQLAEDAYEKAAEYISRSKKKAISRRRVISERN